MKLTTEAQRRRENFMKPEDKKLAEKVLNHLCRNGQVGDIQCGSILQLLISTEDSKKKIRGQIYLNLGSKWAVFESLPISPPQDESDFAETTEEEDLQSLRQIREAGISRIELGNNSPHLLIHFTDGRILYVNGHHEMYECWDLGICFSDPKETWAIIASPEDEVTVFAPEKFISDPLPRSIISKKNGVTIITTRAVNSTASVTTRLDS
jgi:hypothetical protein